VIEKACTQCGVVKPIHAFSKDRHHVTGHKAACKTCSSLKFKTWRAANIDEVRKNDRIKHYVRKYGLSTDSAVALVENKVGTCEICRATDSLVVDHCHSTGNVRGLICGACNSALGYARENISTLRGLIQYIERHNHEQ
jgi:hypothetical protein